MSHRRMDRLSALVGRFGIKAEIVSCEAEPDWDPVRSPNLFAAGKGLPVELAAALPGDGRRIAYFPKGTPEPVLSALRLHAGPDLMMARVDIGGGVNPMAEALPVAIGIAGRDSESIAEVLALILDEHERPRCGGLPLLGRMVEVLVIRLLRQEIARGAAEVGILGGLAHAGLAAAMVAMHEEPQREWVLEDLAALAGMSRTHFVNSFRSVVGVTPIAYLASWRLTIARVEINRGVPVKTVAWRVGYGSAAALSRAYSRHFGSPPRENRHFAAAE